MNLSINVTPEEARILISHAQKRGKDLETYLSELIGSQIVAPLLSAEIHDRGVVPKSRAHESLSTMSLTTNFLDGNLKRLQFICE